jgi:hypothetical protein
MLHSGCCAAAEAHGVLFFRGVLLLSTWCVLNCFDSFQGPCVKVRMLLLPLLLLYVLLACVNFPTNSVCAPLASNEVGTAMCLHTALGLWAVRCRCRFVALHAAHNSCLYLHLAFLLPAVSCVGQTVFRPVDPTVVLLHSLLLSLRSPQSRSYALHIRLWWPTLLTE